MKPCERLLAIPLLELNATTVATWRLPGLPSGLLDLPECSLVMAGTADAERFDHAMVKTATDFDRDVLVLRLMAGEYPVEADIVLRTAVEPMLLTHMRPCRIGSALWFTHECGRSVEVQETGLAIHWQALASVSELVAGRKKADEEIAHFLRGVTF